MDAPVSVDETMTQVAVSVRDGNYRGVVEPLLPLLRAKLSPQQECIVVRLLTIAYPRLEDFEAALPHAQRYVVLEELLHGARSRDHAVALMVLCMVHTRLKAFPAARKAVQEALAIMDELGLQQDEQYGAMLVALGNVDSDQAQCKEALAIFNKARAVLVQFKRSTFGALLNSVATCHQALHQWNEAVASYKESVEHHRRLHGTAHPEYAATLYNLALLFANLKQYEEAILRFEEVLAIYQRVFGDQHARTVQTAEELADIRQLAQQTHRNLIDIGHDFRMCSQCGTVNEEVQVCPCSRAWYCDADCQLKHWPTHKPSCNICLHCDRAVYAILFVRAARSQVLRCRVQQGPLERAQKGVRDAQINA